MTIAHLVWAAFFSCAVGFILGFWRGRKDLRADLDPLVEQLHEVVTSVPTTCENCEAPLKASCSGGCASPKRSNGG